MRTVAGNTPRPVPDDRNSSDMGKGRTAQASIGPHRHPAARNITTSPKAPTHSSLCGGKEYDHAHSRSNHCRRHHPQVEHHRHGRTALSQHPQTIAGPRTRHNHRGTRASGVGQPTPVPAMGTPPHLTHPGHTRRTRGSWPVPRPYSVTNMAGNASCPCPTNSSRRAREERNDAGKDKTGDATPPQQSNRNQPSSTDHSPRTWRERIQP